MGLAGECDSADAAVAVAASAVRARHWERAGEAQYEYGHALDVAHAGFELCVVCGVAFAGGAGGGGACWWLRCFLFFCGFGGDTMRRPGRWRRAWRCFWWRRILRWDGLGPYLSSKDLAREIAARARPEDRVMIYGDQAFGSSLLFYLQRPIDLVEGRTTSMWFGSTFPDAPKIYLSDADLQQDWAGQERVFLFVPPHLKDKSGCAFAEQVRGGGDFGEVRLQQPAVRRLAPAVTL